MAREFPQSTSDAWIQYKHANENKLGNSKREIFPATIGAVTDELNPGIHGVGVETNRYP